MQEQVWSKVELENSMGTVMAPTGSFTANYVQSDNLERLEPYMSALSNQVAERENVVGVIVAVNGELVSMDVFNSTPLFRKLWPKMLKGFALQAANDPAFGEVEACDVEDAREFLAESIGASVTTTLQSGQVAVERRESDDVICLTGRPSDDYAESYGGAMGGGGFGAVHSAVFPKSGGE